MRDPLTIVFDVSRHYVHDVADELGPELTKTILGWIRARDIPKLVSVCGRLGYAKLTPSIARHLMQVEAFFKKNAVFSEPVSCRAAAEQAFRAAEQQCEATNRRVEAIYLDQVNPDVKFLISRSEEYIHRVLGEPKTFLEKLPDLIRLTSGATSTCSRRKSLPAFKISLKPRVTRRAAPYLCALAKWYGHEGKFRPRVVDENRVECVPKNWKTDRTIACEPEGNLPLQLAFDTYAKSRLRRFGIDLSLQTRNQQLAKIGSENGKWATLDLSMASDTVAFNTVAALFPEGWFKVLRDFRTPMAGGQFGRFAYEKFSSMGNGSTFAIETLIFASACYAVGAHEFSVYGDDIIVGTEFYGPLVAYLSELGFNVNEDKSFHEGPFRESCGGNYFLGIDITPFYIREWSGGKSTLSHNVNGLASIAYPGGKLWEFLLDLTIEENLPLVPFNMNSRSGVWIHVHDAYKLGLLRKGKRERDECSQQTFYRALVPKELSRVQSDSRTLFLWHLDANRVKLPRELALERSGYSVSLTGYKRKWVHWHPPVAVTPAHIHIWSESVIPRKLKP